MEIIVGIALVIWVELWPLLLAWGVVAVANAVLRCCKGQGNIVRENAGNAFFKVLRFIFVLPWGY